MLDVYGQFRLPARARHLDQLTVCIPLADAMLGLYSFAWLSFAGGYGQPCHGKKYNEPVSHSDTFMMKQVYFFPQANFRRSSLMLPGATDSHGKAELP